MPSEGALAIECASGLTASVLALALEVLGRDAVLYDKSNWRRRRLEGERKAGAPECLVEPACSAGIGGALGVNSGSVRNGRHLSLSDCLGEEASALCSLESKWTYEEVCALVEEWNDLLDEWLPHLALAHAKSFRDCLRAIGLRRQTSARATCQPRRRSRCARAVGLLKPRASPRSRRASHPIISGARTCDSCPRRGSDGCARAPSG